MTTAPPQLPRFGDPAAPRWIGRRLERLGLPILVGVVIFAVAVIAISLWNALTVGDQPRLIGTVVGASLGVLICIAAFALWSRFWKPLRLAVSRTTLANPSSLVVGGRLPGLAPDVIGRSWPSSIARYDRPQDVVVIGSPQGLRLSGVGQSPVDLVELSWPEILDIALVEYVEAGRAYDGIAIVGPTMDRAIVAQPVQPTLLGASFPRGERLAALRDELLAYRTGDQG